jgi:hypothetical protein
LQCSTAHCSAMQYCMRPQYCVKNTIKAEKITIKIKNNKIKLKILIKLNTLGY